MTDLRFELRVKRQFTKGTTYYFDRLQIRREEAVFRETCAGVALDAIVWGEWEDVPVVEVDE